MAQEHINALPLDHALHWYRLEGVLGQGGFGITYLARDTNLDQRVAIKEYLPVDFAVRATDNTVQPRSQNQSEGYAWGLERFVREAKTLAQFDHPNIVRVYSVFEQNNTAYMVMRYEQGENLQHLLDRGQHLDERALLAIVLPILDGLERIHSAGFIHRDIKPDNIYIREDGSPVLLDFGSARRILGKTHTLTVLMSPGYAPFEQYHSTDEQGPWTDIYSLGATLYRTVAGEPPIDAIARSKGVLGSTKDLLVPAAKIGRGRYSEHFLEAIDHALAFNEKDRPQTIASWQAELQGERVVAMLARRVRRALPPRAAVATAGLIVLVSLGALTWQPMRPPQPPVPIAPEEETPAAERLERLEESLAVLTRQLEEQRRAEATLATQQQALREERKRLEEQRQGAETAPSEEQQAEQAQLAVRARKLDDDRKQLEETQRRLEEQRRKAEEERQRQAAAVRQREEKIAQLLAGAETDLTAERLSTPVGNNALEKFQEVLALAPDNEEARQGMSRIVDRYIALAEQTTKRDEFGQAQRYLDKAAVIDPGSQEIFRARTELAAERAAFDQAPTITSTPVAQTKAISVAKMEDAHQAKTTPARSSPYKIAVFPLEGGFGYQGYLHRERRIAYELHASVQGNPSFKLVFSYYDNAMNQPPITQRDKLWTDDVIRKEPKLQAIVAAARARHVDGVLTSWVQAPFDDVGALPPGATYVRVYFIDVRAARIYERKGTEEQTARLASSILSQFVGSLPAVAAFEKGTVPRPYRLGIFPAIGNFGQENRGTQEERSADILRAKINQKSAFELAYSFYHFEFNAPSISPRGRVWAYDGNDNIPNVRVIGELARERNIDGVLLARGDTPDGWGFGLDGENPQNPVTLYMLDATTGQVYRRQGTFADMNRMAQQVLSDFVRNRPQVAKAKWYLDKVAAIQPDAGIQKNISSAAYKIAIFPFESDSKCIGRARPRDEKLAAELGALLQSNDSLALVYSHYDRKLNHSLIRDPDRLWKGSKPSLSEVIPLGESHGVDAVVMYWRPDSGMTPYCTDRMPPFPIDVYVIDVKQQKTYKANGREKNISALAEQALLMFLAGRR